MSRVLYSLTVGSVDGGKKLNGHFIVNSDYEQTEPNNDQHRIRYRIIEFEFSSDDKVFNGNVGYFEKLIHTRQTFYQFASDSSHFSGDAEVDITGFPDDFKSLPDCLTLFKRLQAEDDPLPGIGYLDKDKLGQYKLQFSKSEYL